ncbi:MAG TPA: alpha/beta hydrolase, partial [Thermoanaerobaculia bacterium]
MYEEVPVEVTVGGTIVPGVPVICAAHPADALTGRAVKLLQDTTGMPVVCVNPRGIGSSPPAPADYDLEDMVDDIEAARRRLGIDRWVFWGISGGGWLGQIYGRKYPQSLTGLILESICPCFRVRLADPECILSPFHPSWRETLASRGMIGADSHEEAGDAGATEWVEVESVGSVFRRTKGPALFVSPFPVPDAMRRIAPRLWSFDARPWLGEIRAPALVLVGDSDPLVPLRHARALSDAIPTAELVILKNAGHSPVMQRRPDLIETVRSF